MKAQPFPRDTADAMAVLADPARHRANPLLIQRAWRFLKEGRDQHRQLHRLGPPCHLTGETCDDGQPDRADHAVNLVEEACTAALPKIRAAVARYLAGDQPKGAA